MDNVLELSTEYGASRMKTDDLDISPHYWNKKCLFVSLVKRLGSYVETWHTMFSFNNKSNIFAGDKTLQ